MGKKDTITKNYLMYNADERFKRVERQVVDVINAVTGSRVKYSKRKGTVDMCLAIQEIRKEGIEEGRLEGREEGRLEGRLEGELIGVIHAYQNMKVSPEDAKSYIMEEYKKSEEETNELLEKYWK